MAFITNGEEYLLSFIIIVFPTQRILLTDTNLSPFTLTASAPAAKSSFTTFLKSVSCTIDASALSPCEALSELSARLISMPGPSTSVRPATIRVFSSSDFSAPAPLSLDAASFLYTSMSV